MVDSCRTHLRHSSKMIRVDKCESHKLNEEMRSTSLANRESATKIVKDFFRNAEQGKGSTDWQDVRHLSKT